MTKGFYRFFGRLYRVEGNALYGTTLGHMFVIYRDMRSHLMMTLDEDDFVERFYYVSARAQFTELSHDGDICTYRCEFCGRVFSTECTTEENLRRDAVEKKLCPDCPGCGMTDAMEAT